MMKSLFSEQAVIGGPNTTCYSEHGGSGQFTRGTDISDGHVAALKITWQMTTGNGRRRAIGQLVICVSLRSYGAGCLSEDGWRVGPGWVRER